MSRNAEAWFFDECEIRGSEGWVLLCLCSYADDNGYAALSKSSLVAKTRLANATVFRALDSLRTRGLLSDADEKQGPTWWLSIPANRRPRLVRLDAFLGSRFATPTDGPGVSQGSHFSGPGVSQGSHDTPSDQPKRDAIVDGVTDNDLRAREADPDCIRCHGSGTLISPTPNADKEPFSMPCACTAEDYEPAPPTATKPPPGFGMPAKRERTEA